MPAAHVREIGGGRLDEASVLANEMLLFAVQIA